MSRALATVTPIGPTTATHAFLFRSLSGRTWRMDAPGSDGAHQTLADAQEIARAFGWELLPPVAKTGAGQ